MQSHPHAMRMQSSHFVAKFDEGRQINVRWSVFKIIYYWRSPVLFSVICSKLREKGWLGGEGERETRNYRLLLPSIQTSIFIYEMCYYGFRLHSCWHRQLFADSIVFIIFHTRNRIDVHSSFLYCGARDAYRLVWRWCVACTRRYTHKHIHIRYFQIRSCSVPFRVIV